MDAGISTSASESRTFSLLLLLSLNLARGFTRPLSMIDSCAVFGWDMADGMVFDYGFVVIVCGSFLNVQGEAMGALIVCSSLGCGARVNAVIDREMRGLGVNGVCACI